VSRLYSRTGLLLDEYAGDCECHPISFNKDRLRRETMTIDEYFYIMHNSDRYELIMSETLRKPKNVLRGNPSGYTIRGTIDTKNTRELHYYNAKTLCPLSCSIIDEDDIYIEPPFVRKQRERDEKLKRGKYLKWNSTHMGII
jgi:hypothetical protein